MTTATFSKHALARILDMALEPDEVRQAIDYPASRRWQSSYGVELWTRGRVTLSVNPGDADNPPHVITVLWATEEAWREDYKYTPAEGREIRDDPFRRKEESA